MKSRAANDKFQKELSKTRDNELKRKQAMVNKRMQERFPMVTPKGMTAGLLSPNNMKLSQAQHTQSSSKI